MSVFNAFRQELSGKVKEAGHTNLSTRLKDAGPSTSMADLGWGRENELFIMSCLLQDEMDLAVLDDWLSAGTTLGEISELWREQAELTE